MDGIRKGTMFTLSILLLSLSFLYLMETSSVYYNSMKDSAISLSGLETLNVHTDDVAYKFESLLLHSAVNVTITESSGSAEVAFEENVPISSQYQLDMINLKQFIETYSAFNTTIDIGDARKPKLYIDPHDITVNHGAGKVTFTTENTTQSAGKIGGYDVIIRLNATTPVMNWTYENTLPESDPDAIYFHMGMQGTNGTLSTVKYLDRNAYSELKLVESNDTIIFIRVIPSASLEVGYETDAYVKTTVYINDTADNTSVELGRNIVAAALNSTGFISKTTGVVIR